MISCALIPQAILGAYWLKEHLIIQFPHLLHVTGDSDDPETVAKQIATHAQFLCSINYLGSAVFSPILGFICKKYQHVCRHINVVLLSVCLTMWLLCMLFVWIPNKSFSIAGIYAVVFISGGGFASIPIIHFLLRAQPVNKENDVQDVASAVSNVVTGCIVAVTYELVSHAMQNESLLAVVDNPFDIAFYFVLIYLVLGYFCIILYAYCRKY